MARAVQRTDTSKLFSLLQARIDTRKLRQQ
jgi:hypothetical protein